MFGRGVTCQSRGMAPEDNDSTPGLPGSHVRGQTETDCDAATENRCEGRETDTEINVYNLPANINK